jgi:hypothetical protein
MGIAMCDPRLGTDVSGVGVTEMHQSKHQIKQLMASAISLKTHCALPARAIRAAREACRLEGIRHHTAAAAQDSP